MQSPFFNPRVPGQHWPRVLRNNLAILTAPHPLQATLWFAALMWVRSATAMAQPGEEPHKPPFVAFVGRGQSFDLCVTVVATVPYIKRTRFGFLTQVLPPRRSRDQAKRASNTRVQTAIHQAGFWVHHAFPRSSDGDLWPDVPNLPSFPRSSNTTTGPVTARLWEMSGSATVLFPWGLTHVGTIP